MEANKDPYLKWLVSDNRGILYKNLYCAICHGINKENIIYWLARITCSIKYYELLNTSPAESNTSSMENNPQNHMVSLQQQLLNKECKVTYSTPINKETFHDSASPDFSTPEIPPGGYRACKPSLSYCPSSWPEDKSTENQCIKELCESADKVHYVYINLHVLATYKNEFCARCYSVPSKDLKCQKPPTFKFSSVGTKFYPMSIVMDLNNGGKSAMRTKVGFELSEEKQKSVTQMLQCPDDHVFDPFQKKCIALVCSKGYIYIDNECKKSASKLSRVEIDCLRVPVSEYHLYENRSLYVNSSDRFYGIEHYEIGSDGQVLVCTDFTQNYTDVQNSTNQKLELKFSPALTIVSVIGQVISIICLIILLAFYALISKLRNIPGKNLMCLSASLLLAQLLFLTGVGATDIEAICLLISALLHYSFMAAFFWINVMSFDIWRTFSQETVTSPDNAKKFLFYSLYGWLSPLFILIISAIVNWLPNVQNGYRPAYAEGLCWITQRMALLIFFGIPLALLLCSNIAFYILTIRHLVLITRTTKIIQQNAENKHRFGLYVKLSVIMGLTWIFGFMATLSEVELLWYVFVILNSLQGAFICVSFVITKKVGRLLMEKWGLIKKKTETTKDTRTRSTSLSTPVLSKSTGIQLTNT